MSNKQSVLVTGGTGQQGGAVARALLSRGHRVRALTRKPDSNAARQLMSTGADLVTGDLGDAASVLKAASGVSTMFLMGNSYEAGTEEETRQGISAAEAAKAAGVGHLIYSSVADANKKTGIPHFQSKYLVESLVAGLGIPYTISAPVAFMENIVAPWSIGALRQGTHAFAMPPKRVLQLVALADIGAFVAALVERREQVFGMRFDFAGDELSGEEQVKTLSRTPSAARSSIRKSQSPWLASKARMQRSCSNGSTASATTPISLRCVGIFPRSAGTVLQTGRASLTGAFLNGRLLSPEFALPPTDAVNRDHIDPSLDASRY